MPNLRNGPLCKRGHVKVAGVSCRECSRIRSAVHYVANRGERLAARRARYLESIDESRAVRREYARRNASTDRVRAWRRANPERAKDHCDAHVARRRAWKHGAGGSHTQAEWRAILAAQHGRCNICGDDSVKLEKDHVVPLSRGGSDDASNLQGLCRRCNARKSNRLAIGVAA